MIADASWISSGHRAAAQAMAGNAAADIVQLRCTAPAEVTARRMRNRTGSASDADPLVARKMAAAQTPWPNAVTIDTSSGNPPGPVTSSADPVRRALNAIRPHEPAYPWRPSALTCSQAELRPRQEPHRSPLIGQSRGDLGTHMFPCQCGGAWVTSPGGSGRPARQCDFRPCPRASQALRAPGWRGGTWRCCGTGRDARSQPKPMLTAGRAPPVPTPGRGVWIRIVISLLPAPSGRDVISSTWQSSGSPAIGRG